MKNNRIKRLECYRDSFRKRYFSISFTFIFMLILFGGMLNLTALTVNGGMMPYKNVDYINGNFSIHFPYNHSSEINKESLVDKYCANLPPIFVYHDDFTIVSENNSCFCTRPYCFVSVYCKSIFN